MEKELTIKPVAYIRSDYKEKFGIPRQSGRAPSLLARIVFTPEYRNDDALRGIEGFSHLWLLFDFSATREKGFSPTVRPPRLGGNKRVGVFASRSPFRPNHIGLSCVKLVAVEKTDE
ncbi:MAG: tRNA (N6-threonylcarbamoyladenosine(37)-N6)-methyltransferase TrmO, partial [Clostridiales bacterium]|nr:tRNA (N6-threonylcarbamoyladenosine(37)-N6)-methyltransferase TrmO [Clostridiales bacterium]